MTGPLDEDALSEYFAALGRKGAKARNQRLSPERRKEIATKASKAAAKVRSAKAKEKRKKGLKKAKQQGE